jgi:flavin-dependent dehydrogenase
MSPLRPIEITGGGLAGLSLGLALRQAGVPVTIFEAGFYPRHRVCGEFIAGLAPETITRLHLTPILADALEHREVAWFLGDNDKPARVQQLPSPALGLSRYRLDARLAAAFVAAGGALHTRTRVTTLIPCAGHVFATGRRRGASSWLGLKIHARRLALVRDLELHLGAHAYVGLSRIEDGAVNICGLFRRRELAARGAKLLLDYLQAAGLATLASRLAAAELAADSFSAVAALSFDQRVPAADRVSLGDACAMIPPFTGNGMAMAFQSAELALEPLLAYARGTHAWTEACGAIHAALRRRFRVRLASAGALHPFLLEPTRQRLLRVLNRAQLLPLRSLYAALH